MRVSSHRSSRENVYVPDMYTDHTDRTRSERTVLYKPGHFHDYNIADYTLWITTRRAYTYHSDP